MNGIVWETMDDDVNQEGRNAMAEFTLTRSELENLLEKTIREFEKYQTEFHDDPECAVFNTISGIMQEIKLRDAFKQFDECRNT